MPMNFLDHLTAILSHRRSKGTEDKVTGSSQSISMVNTPPPYANPAPVAPLNVPHPINPDGNNEMLLGMKNIDSGSNEFLSWINGNGPFVPQPLPADSVPQVVVVSDWCHGLTNEMFEKGNLESGSSQFGVYPSPCIAPVNYLAVRGNDNYFSTQCREMSDAPIVELGRKTRFDDALVFQRFFTNRSSTVGCYNSMEKGTCISSNGAHSWSDKSCGIIWVAVHGMNSICVVTRNEDLEQEMTQCMHALDLDMMKKDLLDVFMQGIIYKVQDLADPMFDQSIKKYHPVGMYVRPSRSSDQSIKKPYAVVSVIQDTHDNGSGHEVSSAEYDEEKAVKFLEDKMKSNKEFTVNKTIQTAISAFQHLFGQKFKANEIRVIVWKEDGDIVKELPSRDHRSVEEQMAVIRARRGANGCRTV